MPGSTGPARKRPGAGTTGAGDRQVKAGGAPAWGAIAAAEGVGLIAGGVLSLRYTPPRPMLLVAGTGFVFALSPLALGLVAPLAMTCVVSCVIGVMAEVMMVQWTVAMATRIRPDMIGRVAWWPGPSPGPGPGDAALDTTL